MQSKPTSLNSKLHQKTQKENINSIKTRREDATICKKYSKTPLSYQKIHYIRNIREIWNYQRTEIKAKGED